MNSFFRFFCYFSALACSITCLFALSGIYLVIGIIPVFFSFFVFFTNTLNNVWVNRPLSVNILIIMLWIRMVMLPFYGTVSGVYSSQSSALELQQFLLSSIFLCIYDSFAIFFLLLVVSTRIKNSPRLLVTGGLYGQKEVYLVFCLIALLVFVTVGRHMHLFDFAIKPVGNGLERVGDNTDSRVLLIGSIVGTGVTFLFLLLLNRFHKRYNRTLSDKYFVLSIICALLLISIISGERRTSQLYKGFASAYLLLSLYPHKSRKTLSTIGIFAFMIIALMTVYKQFNAFMYDSYSEAMQNASLEKGLSYKVIDSYFYGISTIATNLYYGQRMNLGVSQFFYDFFRNVFGINFFIHGDRLLTTQMYNMVIYSGDQMTGLLLTSVGYGYLFGGYVLAPFATIINVLIMLFFERCLRNSKTIEWQYVFAFVFIRFAFGVLSATPPLINLISRLLLINGSIIIIAKMIKNWIIKYE